MLTKLTRKSSKSIQRMNNIHYAALSHKPNAAIKRLQRHCSHIHANLTAATTAESPTPDIIKLGSVEYKIPPPSCQQRDDLIPIDYSSPDYLAQSSLQTLRWLIQKYQLGQDCFLIGPPSSLKRGIVMKWAELLRLEVEFVAITRDTTEADLKQRSELINGSLLYSNSPIIEAALFGRILILENIEKAERNVLPTLNNLLENREINLDDGSMLISHSNFTKLLEKHSAEELKAKKILPVHPNFRVIALALPVPRFVGFSLDPPLRSRFQSRAILPLNINEKLETLAQIHANLDKTTAKNVLAAVQTIRMLENENNSKFGKIMPHFSENAANYLFDWLALFPAEFQPHLINFTAVERAWPYYLLADINQQITINETFQRFNIESRTNLSQNHASSGAAVAQKSNTPTAQAINPFTQPPANRVEFVKITSAQANLTSSAIVPVKNNETALCSQQLFDLTVRIHSPGSNFIQHTLTITGAAANPTLPLQNPNISPSKQLIPAAADTRFILTETHSKLLAPLLLDLHLGRAVCVLGPRGSGKTAFISYLAGLLGYSDNFTTMHCFRDMTSRDLLQRRATDTLGNTVWLNSSLISAAIQGNLFVLDGLERATANCLACLRQLIEEKECRLFDGTRLLGQQRYNSLVQRVGAQKLAETKVYPIHPAFRMVAVASSTRDSAEKNINNAWLTEETLSLFSFHVFPEPNNAVKYQILHNLWPHIGSKQLNALLEFAANLQNNGTPANAQGNNALHLSLRQLLRISTRFAHYPADLLPTIRRTLLADFLPRTVRNNLDQNLALLQQNLREIDPKLCQIEEDTAGRLRNLQPRVENGKLFIGEVNFPVQSQPKFPELVPNILFYNIDSHLLVLADLLRDLNTRERSILLVGMQGTGKNKLTDRLLQLLNWEREYMQLHRDTTVMNLTLTPTAHSGIIKWEDSALVRAVQHGLCFVCDEVDKASVEVVAILKSLCESGEMELADGRKIVPKLPRGVELGDKRFIVRHPGFRCILLANKPGFPFLGNDFIRVIGDVFSIHTIPNPDFRSEMQLLASYGPAVEKSLLEKLVSVFNELRRGVDEGTFVYPYSTRELVAMVKHLQAFPQDGLLVALQNVLHFDLFDSLVLNTLRSVFQQHGIPLNNLADNESLGLHATQLNLAQANPLPKPQLLQTWESKGDNPSSSNNTTTSKSINPVNNGAVRMNHTSAVAKNKVAASERTAVESSARGWFIELSGEKSVESFEHSRLNQFTEEKCSFKVEESEI
jgi:MoxR-like ATPase